MRIAVAHIIYKNWISDMWDISSRTHLSSHIVKSLQSEKVDLVVLPAGFLMTKKVGHCEQAAIALIEKLPKAHPTIVFGVDCRRSLNEKSKGDSTKLPYFGFVYTNDNQKPIWMLRQIGYGSESKALTKNIQIEKRTFQVNNKVVALALCGEMTTRISDVNGRPRIPEYFVKEFGADLILDIAHADLKMQPICRSWIPAIKSTGKPTLVSEHIHRDYLHHRNMVASYSFGPNFTANLKLTPKLRNHTYIIHVCSIC